MTRDERLEIEHDIRVLKYMRNAISFAPPGPSRDQKLVSLDRTIARLEALLASEPAWRDGPPVEAGFYFIDVNGEVEPCVVQRGMALTMLKGSLFAYEDRDVITRHATLTPPKE